MKKFVLFIACLLIVAALAVVAVWLFGREGAPRMEKGDEPPRAEKVASSLPEDRKRMSRPKVELVPPSAEPVVEARVEPTKPPRFEDLPPEKQAQFFEGRTKIYNEAYARRFNMTVEEWDALSPKEQRILIRKGKRE